MSDIELNIGRYVNLDKCRFCDGELEEIIHLGDCMPLAGGFMRNLSETKFEKGYPLTLVHCSKCLVVLCKQVVESDELFRKGYFYYSSQIPTLVKHFDHYAKMLANTYHPKDNNKVVLEMGCNDGVLLRPLKKYGFDVIGVDPSNTVDKLMEDGFDIYNTYMNSEVVQDIIQTHGKVDIFMSSNSFAHINDMKTILRCMKDVLKPNGIAIIEVHYLSAIIDELNFDFIYHEHMSYYSVSSFIEICKIYDMCLYDVEVTSIHGKSIRVYIKNCKQEYPFNNNVQKLTDKESNLKNIESLRKFTKIVYGWRNDFSKIYTNLKNKGKIIHGYGASGRATTLCNFTNLDLNVIIDDSVNKIGAYTPKYHVNIESREILKTSNPDYVIILAWPYTKAIIKNNYHYLEKGGTFIIPLPKIEYITLKNVHNFI